MKRLIIVVMSMNISCYGMFGSIGSQQTAHAQRPVQRALKDNSLRDIGHWLEGAYCHATREFPDNTSLLIILKNLQEEYLSRGPNDFLNADEQQPALNKAIEIVDEVNRDPRVITAKSLISKNPCFYKKTFQPILFDLITKKTELKFPLRESDTMVVYYDLPDDLLAKNQHLSRPHTLVTYLVAKYLLEQETDCDKNNRI